MVRVIQDEGFKTTINLTGAGTLFEEKTVQPPGWDMEEPIKTTTMRNTLWRTQAERALVSMTAGSLKVAYDPEALGSPSALKANQEIVVTFPSGGTLTFWGGAQSFKPDALEEGKQPEATIELWVSNRDDEGTETGPVWADAGTG